MRKQITIPALLVVVLLFASCFGSESKRDVASTGDRVVISECFAAASKDANEEMNRYCNKRDEYNMKLMIALGTARIIPEGATGTVVESHFANYEVRMDDDLTVWWIAKEFVSKK